MVRCVCVVSRAFSYLVQLMFFCGSFALVWAVADGGGVDWEDEPDEPHLPLPPV